MFLVIREETYGPSGHGVLDSVKRGFIFFCYCSHFDLHGRIYHPFFPFLFLVPAPFFFLVWLTEENLSMDNLKKKEFDITFMENIKSCKR